MAPQKKKRLLWADDDAGYIEPHIKELKHNYEIEVVRGPDEVWKSLTANRLGHFDGLIIDVLLPYGTLISARDADGGMKTGLALIDQIKASTEYQALPILVYTIRSSNDVDEYTERYGIEVVRKTEPLDDLISVAGRVFG